MSPQAVWLATLIIAFYIGFGYGYTSGSGSKEAQMIDLIDNASLSTHRFYIGGTQYAVSHYGVSNDDNNDGVSNLIGTPTPPKGITIVDTPIVTATPKTPRRVQ